MKRNVQLKNEKECPNDIVLKTWKTLRTETPCELRYLELEAQITIVKQIVIHTQGVINLKQDANIIFLYS